MRKPLYRNSLRVLLGAACIIFLTFFLSACGRSSNSATNGPGSVGELQTLPETASCPTTTTTANVLMYQEQFVSNQPNTYTVNQVNPSIITVPADSTVQWYNADTSGNYWVNSELNSFSTGTVGPGGSLCIHFKSPGTFNYHCAQTVTGTVIVTAPTTS